MKCDVYTNLKTKVKLIYFDDQRMDLSHYQQQNSTLDSILTKKKHQLPQIHVGSHVKISGELLWSFYIVFRQL